MMPQKILVFQQNGSGLKKVAGIEKYGKGLCRIKVFDIDQSLPLILDETSMYLPDTIHADLVLDFLKHPDLSYDLAGLCLKKNIPVVASGKKEKRDGVLMPPV
jgi:hypothetical protein